MESAVVAFETAIKDAENKLDTITWKLQSYEKDILNYLKQSDKGKIVSIMELMHNIREIRIDFSLLREELLDVEEKSKEVKTNLTEQITSTYNDYSILKDKLKNYELR